MAASSSTVHGRTADEPRSLLAECAGMDARAPRPRGCPFFGYFLWASKESDSAARTADEKTHGREPVLAKRPDNTKRQKSKWIPASAGMTAKGAHRNDGGEKSKPKPQKNYAARPRLHSPNASINAASALTVSARAT